MPKKKEWTEWIKEQEYKKLPVSPWKTFPDGRRFQAFYRNGELSWTEWTPQKVSSAPPPINPLKGSNTGIESKRKTQPEKIPSDIAQLVEKGRKFTESCKHDRLDNLRKAMVKAWNAFVKEEGRIPKTFELWDWIPVGGHITEKDEDNTIYWKQSNGKDAPPTSFKAFKNRYTALKKKLSPSTISK